MANSSSKLAVNLASRSRIRNLVGRPCSARSKFRLRAGWVTHSHRIGGNAAHMDPPGVEPDEEEHSEAAMQHRVDVEEVTGQHRRRLGTRTPTRLVRSVSARLDAATAQDRPHAGGGKTHAHRGRLAMVLPIAKGRILPGQPHHQLDRSRWKSRLARPPVLRNAHRRPRSRCQRSIVSGCTRNRPRRTLDISRLNPARVRPARPAEPEQLEHAHEGR